MPRNNPFEQSYRHTSPMVGIKSIKLANKTKLANCSGMIGLNCDHCEMEYETQACWAKRTNHHFCSHSCHGEHLRIEIKKECCVCGTEFITNPTTYYRKTTCSPKCSRTKRKQFLIDNPIPRFNK